MKLEKNADIIVIGGGMVGLVLALALAEKNFQVILLEKQPPLLGVIDQKPVARVSAMNLNSIALLKNLGLWDRLHPLSKSSLQRLQVWDSIGAGKIEFDAKDIGVPQLGSIVQNCELVKQAWQLLTEHKKCEVICDYPVSSSSENNTVRVELSNGTVLRASLCVGADGGNSWVRQQMNVTLRERSYSQRAIIAVVTTEMPHQQTAFQVFLPTGPLAFLPLVDSCQCAIVWSNTIERAETLLAMSIEAFECELNNAFGLPLGEIRFHSDRHVFPLTMRHAEKYTQGHFVLVGDAAHMMHPLAGQGVNLGFLDAACLVDCLVEARKKNQPIAAQKTRRRYERWRKGDNTQMILVMRGLNDLFTHESGLAIQMRSMGLNMVNRFVGLKKYFMENAANKKTDLPSLALYKLPY